MNRLRRTLVPRDYREESDSGLSLSELLVAIMIFGFMMVIVSGLFISLSKATGNARTTDVNVRQVSNGMNEVTRIIRAGTNNPVQNAAPNPAFSEATNESLTIYAFVNLTDTTQKPIMVRFSVDSQRRLIETTTQSTDLGSGYFDFKGAQTQRILATAVAPQSGSDPSLFTYQTAAGIVIPTQANGSLLSTQYSQVGAVQVTLKVKASATSNDTGVTLQNTVGIPNLTNTGAVS